MSSANMVLWLNKETLEEKYLAQRIVIRCINWAIVPDGATFATGDKDNFVFRKDGWYYNKHTQEWVATIVRFDDVGKHDLLKMFWIKSSKQVDKYENKFTLQRLLGCEVEFQNDLYHVIHIYRANGIEHLILENDSRRAYVSDLNLLTFFTEDGDELTFDEYVAMYYPKG